VRHIRYRVSLSNSTPRPVEKTPEMAAWLREREMSATALDSYLRCPLSFYYKTVLGLNEREQPRGEFEQTDIGRFVHDALRLYFAPRAGRLLTAADADRKAMDAVVTELFRKQYGGEDGGAARLLARQLRAHLGDFVSGWLSPLVRGSAVEVTHMEEDSTVVWNGFRLRGRIDAVLVKDGVQWVIDYKTSASDLWYRIRPDRLDIDNRETWAQAVPTLQLPFYLALQPSASRAMFLLLGKSHIDGEIELPLFEDGEFGELPRLHEVMRRLLEEISSPDVPFTSTLDTKQSCPSCAFMTLCGTRWRA
jgi:ATP-dependent helicase/nuclease subunit B